MARFRQDQPTPYVAPDSEQHHCSRQYIVSLVRHPFPHEPLANRTTDWKVNSRRRRGIRHYSLTSLSDVHRRGLRIRLERRAGLLQARAPGSG